MMRNLIAWGWVLATVGVLIAADKPSFDTATRAPYSAPPEKSINGKSIEEMKSKIKEMWGDIVFEKDGKAIDYTVTLETDAGDIAIEFYPEDAPNHARNFIALAKVGFFDGLIFHRCIPRFVIQGGCPVGSGIGGPGYCVKPEFNARKHVKGILSMARAQPKDSAGSQFFICLGEVEHLDGQYTVFGKVTKGLEAVDQIGNAETGELDRPVKPVHIKGAKVEMKTR